ncbi:MAG: hypothetical protein Q8L55_02315, partial [Phycisphaerales bacterium]|nr:hypothetical protein [Phycisphaerales bacterium]
GFDVVDIPSTTAFPAMRLHIALVWRWFIASTDAFRLRGSFNVTHPDFKGQFAAPTFPFQRMGPSSAWQPTRRISRLADSSR